MEGQAMMQQQQQPMQMQAQQQQPMQTQQQALPPTQAVFSEQDTAIVDEIINGITEQNQESQNNSNNAMYQRQTDVDSNVMRQGLPPPTPEQIQEMNTINQQNQMNIENEKNMQFKNLDEQMMSQNLENFNSNESEYQTINNIFDNAKDAIIVVALLFIFMLTPINNLMTKIPNAIDSFGNVTLVGNAIKALVAGILYFVYVRYLR